MSFPTETSEWKPDPLVDYLTKKLDELRFDKVLESGDLWCSDSNASVDPHEMAKEIREVLNVV